MGYRVSLIGVVLLMCYLPWAALAIETAPRITDREISERLTKLEEGQKRLAETLQAEMRANTRAIEQLRQEMVQLRQDMNAQFGRIDAQFGRLTALMIGIVGAFAVIVAATGGFALWDRRTMLRPFEDKMRIVEAELSQNRQQLRALLDALRQLSQRDEHVAAVLRQFGLL